MLLSYKLLATIVSLLPERAFPHEASIHVNGPVLLFCVIVALLTGIAFGLAPALRLSRPDVRDAMSSGSRRTTGARGGRATHNALIAGQIAITLLLLSTAGAAIQAFLKIVHRPLGYDPKNVMSVGVPLQWEAHKEITARATYLDGIVQGVAHTLGVQETAVSMNATPPDNGFEMPVAILGQTNEGGQKVRWNLISANYFSLLRVPLMQGRLWTESEAVNGAKVAVVNQAFVRKYFPNGDVLGHAVAATDLKPEPPQVVAVAGANSWLQIVGVTGDKLDNGMTKPVEPEISMPYTLAMGPFSQILVRTDGPPLSFLHAIATNIAQVNAEQQVNSDVRDLDRWIATQPEYARGQLIAWLFAGFAGLALLLAAAGLYSVVSYTVAQRTNEFGIRIALGAARENVLALVFRSLLSSVGAGILIGMVLTVAFARVMKSVVGPGMHSNVAVLLLAVVQLVVVAFIASGLPARRALRIELMEALRYE